MSVEAALEAILFAIGDPAPLDDLARAVERGPIETEGVLRSLQASLSERGSGVQLIRIANGWQLATRPEHAEAIGRMVTRGANRLSRAALETLAIVAYRQPITIPEIEAVRGVSVGGVVKSLVERRLIAESGRRATLGRPMDYRTTDDFLHYFGIADLTQLPALEEDSPLVVPAELIVNGIEPSEAAVAALEAFEAERESATTA